MTRKEALKRLIDIRDEGTAYPDAVCYVTSEDEDALNVAIEALSAEAVPQLKQTDTLIIADALRYLAQDTERYLTDRTRADALRQQFLKYGASMCKGGEDE